MKKGFTLIELMGVIAIIAVIGSVITVTVNNNIYKSQMNLCKMQENTIIEAAKMYLVDNPNKNINNSRIKVVSELQDQGYLDEKIVNPINKEKYNDSTYVLVENSDGTGWSYSLKYVGEDATTCSGRKGEKIPISDFVVTLNHYLYAYDGEEKRPQVIVKNDQNEKMILNSDYTITYSDNKNVGTALVTIEGKGKYNGSVTKEFRIEKLPTYENTNVEKTGVNTKVTFPSGCGNTYECTYSKNNAEDVTVTTSTQTVLFSNSGNIVSKIKYKNEEISNTNNILIEPLMKSWTISDTTDFHNSTYKKNVTTIEIVNHKNIPNNAIDSWDIGVTKNGGVIAWILDDPNNAGKYKLYIGGDKKVYANYNSSYLFYNFSDLKTINLKLLDTSKVTTMKDMFYSCGNLTTLDLSNFDTSKVTDMSYMFSHCSNLTSLDVSKFDTSNVTNMRVMFLNCKKLSTLNVSSFNTSKVTDMKGMFDTCKELTALNLSNFNTSNVTTMEMMFDYCSKLVTLNISNFDTSKVTTMSWMFESCTKLSSLDVSKFNTSNVTNMYALFGSCMTLTNLNVSNFNTSKVTNMGSMFSNCNNVTSIDVSKFDTSKVTNMNGMFYRCLKIKTLNLSKFNTSKVTDMWDMFHDCSSLTTLSVSSFDTANVTTMQMMFYGCSSLTSLNLSNFNTAKVTGLTRLFMNCSSLTSLDLSSFNTSNVTSMVSTFKDCSNLVKIYVSNNFVTNKVASSASSSDMFQGCSKLVGGNGTKYNSSYTNKTYARIDKSGQPGYFTKK